MNKIKMGGIKMSEQLVSIHQNWSGTFGDASTHLYQWLAQDHINMVYGSMIFDNGFAKISCLATSDTLNRLEQYQHPDHSQTRDIHIQADRGIISIFPHQNNIHILTRLFGGLTLANISPASMSASLSAISFVLDYAQQEDVLSCFYQHFELPPYHAPFKSQDTIIENQTISLIRKPEIKAEYHETKIKTYGFVLKTDLVMVILDVNNGDLSKCHVMLEALGKQVSKFWFSSLDTGPDGIRFMILVEPSALTEPETLKNKLKETMGQGLKVQTNIEMIHFYGPHFGDRYGITDAALTCLKDNHVPVLAASCSSASIFIILPEKQGTIAQNLLTQVFEVV